MKMMRMKSMSILGSFNRNEALDLFNHVITLDPNTGLVSSAKYCIRCFSHGYKRGFL